MLHVPSASTSVHGTPASSCATGCDNARWLSCTTRLQSSRACLSTSALPLTTSIISLPPIASLSLTSQRLTLQQRRVPALTRRCASLQRACCACAPMPMRCALACVYTFVRWSACARVSHNRCAEVPTSRKHYSKLPHSKNPSSYLWPVPPLKLLWVRGYKISMLGTPFKFHVFILTPRNRRFGNGI